MRPDEIEIIRSCTNWSDEVINRIGSFQEAQIYINANLVGEGYPLRDGNGDPYELHHIGQQQDSPLAELTWSEHMGDGNNTILHPLRESEIDRQTFASEKKQHWMARYNLFSNAELEKIYGQK